MTDIEKLYDLYCKHYSGSIDTFEQCSIDLSGGGIPLCHSQTKCFNFDKIKHHTYINNDPVCSVDSLYFDIPNNCLYFIEFKNRDIYEAKGNFIRSERESYITNRYLSTFGENINLSNIRLQAIIVISEDKNSNYYAKLLHSKHIGESKDKVLERFKSNLINYSFLSEKLFYNDVKIYNEKQFDSEF